MTQYITLNIKLSKSWIKNNTEVTLNVSLNVVYVVSTRYLKAKVRVIYSI